MVKPITLEKVNLFKGLAEQRQYVDLEKLTGFNLAEEIIKYSLEKYSK